MTTFSDELRELWRLVRESAATDFTRLGLARIGIGAALLLAVGLCCEFARADGPAREEEDLPPGFRWWTAEDAQGAAQAPLSAEGERSGRRPLDDSDPEMRDLAQRFFGQGACNRGPGGRCPEAAQPLVDGGDRMARYLIRQYEQSLAEGYPDTATLMTAIGGTASPIGTSYVVERVERPRDETEADFALSALQECRSGRAVDAALRLLDRAPRDDWRSRVQAVRAVEINLREGKLERPDALERLREISGRQDGSPVERKVADRALRAIESGAE